MNSIQNTQNLSKFVHENKLMNSFSVVDFRAIVSIKTNYNEISKEEMRIMVHFDGYNCCGVLKLLEYNLNPYLYPTEFDAKWQTFEYISGQYLKISGSHKSNPQIGDYEVNIIPLYRTKE